MTFREGRSADTQIRIEGPDVADQVAGMRKIAEQFSQNAIYSSVYTSLQKYKKNAENIRNRGRSHNNADSAKNASGETNSTKISAKTQQTVTRSRNSKIRNFSIAGIVALVLIAILFLANLL